MVTVSIDNELVNSYTLDELDTVLEMVKPSLKLCYKYRLDDNGKRYRVNAYNIPCVFDIEATSFYTDKDGNNYDCITANNMSNFNELTEQATMYHNCLTIGFSGGVPILMRTWQEFIDLLRKLKEKLKLDNTHQLIIYVHQLKYEFDWFKGFFTYDKDGIFSNGKLVFYAKPQGIITKNGIEDISGIVFKCSYALSGVKEFDLPKIMYKYGNMCNKLEGYDYFKLRHSQTPLDNFERAYIINDCRTVVWYLQDLMEYYNCSIIDLKLTQTGYIREFYRNRCFFSRDDIHSRKDYRYKKHKKLLENIRPDLKTYAQLNRTFSGGFCSCGHLNINKVIEGVICHADITSSYISTICEQFPMSKFKDVRIDKKDQFIWYLQNKCCIFDICLENIRAIIDFDKGIDTSFEHILSRKKCYQIDNTFGNDKNSFKPVNAEWEHNRLVSADKVYLTLNEVDLATILKYYKIDSYKILNFRVADKGYLPKYLINACLEAFSTKCEYSDRPDSIEYRRSKVFVSSFFGMCGQKEIQDSYIYDPIKHTFVDEEDSINDKDLNAYREAKLNKTLDNRDKFTSYAWSTYICSYAKRNVLDLIYRCMLYDDNDNTTYIYVDTDGVYFLYNEDVIKYIAKYNSIIDNKFNAMFDYYNIPKNSHKFTIVKDGVPMVKGLGYFELDSTVINGERVMYYYKKFVSNGMKQYLTCDMFDNIVSTCSGLSKSNISVLIDIYGDKLFETFAEGKCVIPANKVKDNHKATHINTPTHGKLVDYLGNSYDYKEYTSVHIDNIKFSQKNSKLDDLGDILDGQVDTTEIDIY